MLFADYQSLRIHLSKKIGKKTVCNFEIHAAKGQELIAFGEEHFGGDWTYRHIIDSNTYCVYVNDESDRLLMLLGWSEHCHDPINDGKRWFRM